MKLSLHKDLASSGWHTSILTTYSVDSAFYDSYIERRLRRHGVRNNILMADHSMLAQSMNSFPESFTGAGSRYAVIPVKVTGAFHPKIHLRLGEHKASLVLGSANVTGAGWGKNQEVVTRLDWEQLVEPHPDNEVSLQLIGRTYRYLKGWLSKSPGDAIRHKLEFAERRAPWLFDLELTSSPLELSDGTLIDLLLESGGDSPSILAQFTKLLLSEEPSRLILISPYWDVKLEGFRELRKTLHNPETLVALNPKVNTFPVNFLHTSELISFVRLGSEGSSKFVHAKIFIAQTEHWDHVLFGSANCSDDALGYTNGPSLNAEACVYRRYPKGEAINLLEIDLDQKVERKDVNMPLPASLSPSRDAQPSPGNLELHGSKLIWWPPQNGPLNGEAVEICGETLPLQQERGTAWNANFTAKVTYPLIGRIRYSNGELSSPTIVHFPKDLKSAIPVPIDAKLREALEKAFNADWDLIELAAKAELIFGLTPGQQGHRATSSSNGYGKKNQTSPDAFTYENEAAFRAAMLAPATGRSRQIFNSDIGMQDLFSLVAKGVLPKIVSPSDMPNDEDDEVLVGDMEDDVEDTYNDESADVNAKNFASPPSKETANFHPNDRQQSGTYTSKMVCKRRETLIAAVERFEKYLASLKVDSSISLSHLPIQTTFIFALMQYGVTHKHFIREDKQKASMRKSDIAVDVDPIETISLLAFAEDGLGKNHDYAFVPMCVRILIALWAGPEPLGTRLEIPASHEMLPDDVFEMIVASRWALARTLICLKQDAGKNNEWRPTLVFKKLNNLSSQIFKSTGSLGPIDPIAELNAMREKDAAFGFTALQTKDLLQILNQLS
ncbi:hypothetical protein [Janthinobacterium sp. SUN118]|uniref:hypothetical protein n=1 Tax=Janthinobacterium sp. SUN118 TaxID=3004100 RepID=UPI0025AF5EAF|nr:hypothetical protein [Janthinobacterium sp. SUN118]